MKRLAPLAFLILGIVPMNCDTARVAAQPATAAMARICPIQIR